MTTETVRIEDVAGVRTIVLNRPEKKNAITTDMYRAMDDALTTAATDDRISVVRIRGEGDIFTAGNDIGDFSRASAAHSDGTPRSTNGFLSTIATFPKPLMAAVNGMAIGIGATMLLHCDYVVASSVATFQFPFTKLGLVPEAGSSVLLAARVGGQRASEWLLFGDRIDAETALRSGLINAVVPADRLEEVSTARAVALTKAPIGALIETKRLLREPHRAAVAEAMTRELKVFAERLGSKEAAAAFAAFLSRSK